METETRRQLCEVCPESGNPGLVTMWCRQRYTSPCLLNSALKRRDAECPRAKTIPMLQKKRDEEIAKGYDTQARWFQKQIDEAVEYPVLWKDAALDPIDSTCQGKTELSVEQAIENYRVNHIPTNAGEAGPRGERMIHPVYVSVGARS